MHKFSDDDVACLNFISGFVQAHDKDQQSGYIKRFVEMVGVINRESGLN